MCTGGEAVLLSVRYRNFPVTSVEISIGKTLTANVVVAGAPSTRETGPGDPWRNTGRHSLAGMCFRSGDRSAGQSRSHLTPNSNAIAGWGSKNWGRGKGKNGDSSGRLPHRSLWNPIPEVIRKQARERDSQRRS